MKWQKPSQKIIELYESIIPDIPLVERRKMFGYPCGFVNRNMFLGTFEESVFIYLSEPDREEFLNLPESKHFEPMPGRIMKEYVIIPIWLLEKKKELNQWIQRSLAYVSSLPPKEKKKRKK
jgi:TfoX/Sxy family transcriptional regulator of competence genes